MDNEDKRALIKNLKHQIFLWGVYLIFGSLAVLFVFIILEKATGFDTMLGYQVFVFLYLCLALAMLYPLMKEIKTGLIDLKEVLVINKRSNKQHLYTGNAVYDAKHQPVAYEYFLTIDGDEIQVEEKYYNEFSIGEKIKVHSSRRNGKMLRITKA